MKQSCKKGISMW